LPYEAQSRQIAVKGPQSPKENQQADRKSCRNDPKQNETFNIPPRETGFGRDNRVWKQSGPLADEILRPDDAAAEEPCACRLASWDLPDALTPAFAEDAQKQHSGARLSETLPMIRVISRM
jgi:hypothetical protein